MSKNKQQEKEKEKEEVLEEILEEVEEEGLDEDLPPGENTSSNSDLPLEGKVSPEVTDEGSKDTDLPPGENASSNSDLPLEGKGDREAVDGVSSEKKPLFGKKNKKDPYKEKFEEMQDKYMRQVAEFDNFRKRTEKEKSQMFDNGAMNVLNKILPVIDNFERGFDMVEETDKEDAFVDGMNKVYKQLMTELENMGVTPIEAVGKEFDPNIHNAVMQVESDEYDSGIVAQEMLRGYMYHDNVLRFSMVAVVS